jgi:hypothetical protein
MNSLGPHNAVLIDLIGYAASCAVLATFLMRTMVSLRAVAILSNCLFLAYGYCQHLYPVFLLHLALLPINVWRFLDARPGQRVLSALACVTVFIIAAYAASAMAEAGVGSPLCASRDVQVIVLIEDHGASAAIGSAALAKAGLMQMQARLACAAGRVTEAVARYDEIINTLGPIRRAGAR